MMGYGFGGGGMVFGLLVMLGFLLLVVLGIWALITWLHRTRPQSSSSPPDARNSSTGRGHARETLDERYARGELTTEDYLHRIQVLDT